MLNIFSSAGTETKQNLNQNICKNLSICEVLG